MAYDKVVDSAFLEAGLTLVGDSIRAKGGTSAKLEFPNGMKAAVEAIDTSEDLDDVLDEQESLIDQIQAALEGKAAGGGEPLRAFYYITAATATRVIYFTEGMTWGDYIDSFYNEYFHPLTEQITPWFYRSGTYVVTTESPWHYVSQDGTAAGRVSVTDSIIANKVYKGYDDD